MNWTTEADAIQEKMLSMAGMREAMIEAELDGARAIERENFAFFLNRIYRRSLETGAWRATSGAVLVEELWSLINIHA